MCGLVGIASSNLLASDKSVFKTLLYLDQIRGAHSTGVCAVDDKSGAHVYKRALAASDFIQLRGYADTVAKGNRVLIGHNRYATLGAKDDNNAHPFSHGGVTLVHNGTLVNKGELLEEDDRVVFPTDSETITYALSLYDWQRVLESLEGAFALVWYDSRDNTLNFARNEERPLWLGVMGGDLVWASERSMLELTASNEKLALKDLVQLPVGKLFCYDVGDLSAAPVEADFTPKKRKPTYQRGGAKWRSTTTSFRERKEGFVTEIRDSGYCVAHTIEGERLVFSLPNALIAQAKGAQDTGGMVCGSVASSNKLWHKNKYIDSHSISSVGVTFLTAAQVEAKYLTADDKEETKEKKCCICLAQIKHGDAVEEHMGEIYHTSCLDADYKDIARGAI